MTSNAPINNEIIKLYMKEHEKHPVKWVLLDCFDTILHRKMHTENIKMIWSNKICDELKFSITPFNLYKIRIEAEEKVSLEKGIIIKEFTYWDLIEQIYLRLTFCENMQIGLEELYHIALEIEIELECQYCYIDEVAEEAILFWAQNNVKMAVVSDFYISESGLSELLKRKNINYFSGIFVSCDYNAGKYSGRLYENVLKCLNINADDALMIGDNIKSDILMAQKKGIRAFHKKWDRYPAVKNYNTVSAQLLKLSNSQKMYCYENYAFILYYFIDKLYKNLVREDVSEILFLAREGQFLKELFDIYLMNKKGSQPIKTFYFCTSRIASFAAGLRDIREETFEDLFNRYADMSIQIFLQSIGWDRHEITELQKNTDLDIENYISGFGQSSEFRLLKENETFKKLYDKHRIEQNKYLQLYLQQMGVNLKSGLHVIDVGWRGTIQDNIWRCFKGNIEIHGYYIGLSKLWSNSSKNYKHGIIFSEYPCKSAYFNIWNFDKFMLERILLASHPTTTGYKSENGKITPIYTGYLNETEAYQYIRPYQERVKKLFTDILDIFTETIFNADDLRKVFALIHLKMLFKIGSREIKMQKRLYDYNHESFGEFSKTKAGNIKEVVQAVKCNKVPVRKILKNGINLKYIQSVSITTYCVTHQCGWALIFFYRILYFNERRKLVKKDNEQNYDNNV